MMRKALAAVDQQIILCKLKIIKKWVINKGQRTQGGSYTRRMRISHFVGDLTTSESTDRNFASVFCGHLKLILAKNPTYPPSVSGSCHK